MASFFSEMEKRPSWEINLLGSVIGVTLAEFVTVPICTLKTVLQTESKNSIYATFQIISEQRGIYGLFRSFFISSTNQICSQSAKYTLYYQLQLQKTPEEKSNLVIKIKDSLTASGIVTVFSHPLDVCRVMIQRNESIKSEWKQFGFKRFYFGLDKSWLKMFVGACCYMPIYDFMIQNTQNPFLSSLITATIATTIVHPFDYIKTLKMANKPIHWNLSLFHKGLGLHYARIIPHFVITMCTTEYIKKSLL